MIMAEDFFNMSSLIPSVLNRLDFWAMLLPGYVVIILGILFFPSFLLTNSNDTASDNIQFDIFSAVVFRVTGPAIGFT